MTKTHTSQSLQVQLLMSDNLTFRLEALSRLPGPPLKSPRCRVVKTANVLWRECTVGRISIDGGAGSGGRQSELQWYPYGSESSDQAHSTGQMFIEETAMWQINLQRQQMRCSPDQLCRLRASRKTGSSSFFRCSGGYKRFQYNICNP
ncbi:hypothetical protein V8E54_007073 [Elaphomyces granulatus]|jgi:hypothetical protein